MESTDESATPSHGRQCSIDAKTKRELELFLAETLIEEGFPKAAPAPVLIDVPAGGQVEPKSVLTVDAVTRFNLSSPHPTCMVAIRAELAFGFGARQKLVLWSLPMAILEADATNDPDKPSEDLQRAVRKKV